MVVFSRLTHANANAASSLGSKVSSRDCPISKCPRTLAIEHRMYSSRDDRHWRHHGDDIHDSERLSPARRTPHLPLLRSCVHLCTFTSSQSFSTLTYRHETMLKTAVLGLGLDSWRQCRRAVEVTMWVSICSLEVKQNSRIIRCNIALPMILPVHRAFQTIVCRHRSHQQL